MPRLEELSTPELKEVYHAAVRLYQLFQENGPLPDLDLQWLITDSYESIMLDRPWKESKLERIEHPDDDEFLDNYPEQFNDEEVKQIVADFFNGVELVPKYREKTSLIIWTGWFYDDSREWLDQHPEWYKRDILNEIEHTFR